ncbi:hypothetical protein GCM10027047_01440 [Rhodococcus aerolatus]
MTRRDGGRPRPLDLADVAAVARALGIPESAVLEHGHRLSEDALIAALLRPSTPDPDGVVRFHEVGPTDERSAS